jgi:hypothetical protein
MKSKAAAAGTWCRHNLGVRAYILLYSLSLAYSFPQQQLILISSLSLSYLLQVHDFLSSQILLSRLFFASFLHSLSLSLCSWPETHEKPESPEKKPVRRRPVSADLGRARRDRVRVAAASYGVCSCSAPSPPPCGDRRRCVSMPTRNSGSLLAWAVSRRGCCRHSDSTASARLRHDYGYLTTSVRRRRPPSTRRWRGRELHQGNGGTVP